MNRLFLQFILTLLTFRLNAADNMPTKLVGEWTLKNYQGWMLVIETNGTAKIIVPPKSQMVGEKCDATYDPTNNTLTLELQPKSVVYIYDENANTLTPKGGLGQGVLRKSRVLPN